MNTLITTIIKRPYVFLFLMSYIIIATKVVNWRFMLKFLIVGYAIAFVSEYLSINYGFPYGWYFYKYENLTGEWLNNGVPVWDSVSYVFMCFAGLYFSVFGVRGSEFVFRKKLIIIFISAMLVTILDIIIDPVSHLGKQWFLGEIYYYPEPGWYFDITMANFAGWFLVSFVINGIGVFVLKFDKLVKITKINNFLAIGLYFGIACFGLCVAVYLREWWIVLADLVWVTVIVIPHLMRDPVID